MSELRVSVAALAIIIVSVLGVIIYMARHLIVYLVVGGMVYLGVKEYRKYQARNTRPDNITDINERRKAG